MDASNGLHAAGTSSSGARTGGVGAPRPAQLHPRPSKPQKRKRLELEAGESGLEISAPEEEDNKLPLAEAVQNFLDDIKTFRKPQTHQKYEYILQLFSEYARAQSTCGLQLHDGTTLEGSGPAQTILDFSGAAIGILLQNGTATVKLFHLQNAATAIFAYSGSNITATNLIITNSSVGTELDQAIATPLSTRPSMAFTGRARTEAV